MMGAIWRIAAVLCLLPGVVLASHGSIEARGQSFVAAFNAGDAAAMAALYTEDAVLRAPEMREIAGRAHVEAIWQGIVEAGGRDMRCASSELSVHGDRATETGTYTMSVSDGAGGRTAMRGNYVIVWRLGPDGEWYLSRDMRTLTRAD